MNYTFSNRIQNVKPSAIREILKMTAQYPDIIALSTGSPSDEAIPVSEIREISQYIFENMAIPALQYSVTEGYPSLRAKTKERLQTVFSIGRDFDDVIITSGGQQGLEIVPKVLCNEGDTVLVESPTFVSGINAIKSQGANVIGLEMDEEGIRMDLLEEAVKTHSNVKLLYIIPTFQNPSGKTMSLARRRDIYDFCLKHHIIILEDNPYAELRFRGEDIPTLKSMDHAGIVIYNGSYSKVISAGMRIGFLCAPTEIMERLIIAKQVGDCHTNIFFQIVTDLFLRNYDFNAHIKKIQNIYHHKCDLMLQSMDAQFDKRDSYTRPDGGLFLWCTLPEKYDSMDLARLCLDKGVAFVPGCSFMVDDTAPCPSFRLNYSTPSDDELEKGISILSNAITEFLN